MTTNNSTNTTPSIQNNGTDFTARQKRNFAGSSIIAVDDSTNNKTTLYNVNPAEFTLLGGGL